MSLAVLDLNDAGVVIGDATGLLATSPAYALLEPGAAVLGEPARQRARLDPRRTLNHFWHRLGTEPLHHAPAHTRHNADLAWRHLLQLHDLAGKPAELLLAVPGSLSREQLALLLGIAERCPFRAVGLVDGALAAASTLPFPAAAALHVELQLHQAVLTRLEREGDSLARGAVLTLPGTGLAPLQDRWARRAAAAFIQQTRFDPLHAASAEQQLHDRLPGWLAVLAEAESVDAELQHGANRYRATLRAGDMLEAVQSLYAGLLEAIAREAADASLLLGSHAAALPRLAERLPDALPLAADAVVRGALLHAGRIRSEERALRFVLRLPASGAPAPVPAPLPEAPSPAPAPEPTASRAPTHLVALDQALRLAPGELSVLGNAREGWRLVRGIAADARCRLVHDGAGWLALPAPGVLLRVDGLPAPRGARITAGTQLGIEEATLLLVAEATVDGDAP